MTVCIALLCEMGRKIVGVSDHMLSMEAFSADSARCKSEPVQRNWYAMWSGDASYVPLVTDLVTRQYLDQPHNPDQHEMATAFANAYNSLLRREITNRHLARLGFKDVDDFRMSGRERLTVTAFNAMLRKIGEVDLNTDFLVAGFGKDGDGHIFVLDSEGATKSCDAAGFWAIGSGSYNALSTIFHHVRHSGFNRMGSLRNALYVGLEAKFMAESADGVGEKTFVTVYESCRSIAYIHPARIATGWYLSDSRNPNILWFQKSGSAEHLTKDL
jgi:hypothetical protein